MTRDNVTVALGTNGVLVLIEGHVRTAFLPGHGQSQAVVQARQQESDPTGRHQLLRERGMRSGRKGQWKQHSAEDPIRQQKSSLRSRDENLYYEVFRPVVQWIRKQYPRVLDCNGLVQIGKDYALLKEVLPPMSGLKLPQWQELRTPSDQAL